MFTGSLRAVPGLEPMLYVALWIAIGAVVGYAIARSNGANRFGGTLIGAALGPIGWVIVARSTALKAMNDPESKYSNAFLIAGLNVAIVFFGMLIGGIVATYLDYTNPGEGRVRPGSIQISSKAAD